MRLATYGAEEGKTELTLIGLLCVWEGFNEGCQPRGFSSAKKIMFTTALPALPLEIMKLCYSGTSSKYR